MPLYDYECGKCGFACELQIKLDEPDPPCPECKTPMKKTIHSAPSFRMGRSVDTGKPFFSEREVESKYGRGWRETARNPYREGGDRSKDYHYRSASNR